MHLITIFPNSKYSDISITWLIDYGYIIHEFCGSLHMHWDQLVHFQAPNVTCWWFGVQQKVSGSIGSL